MLIYDMLNEICLASASKSSAALSKFLKVPIAIESFSIEPPNFDPKNLVSHYDGKAVSLFLAITGSLTGNCIMLYSRESALSLCDLIFKREEKNKTIKFEKIEMSALSEIANIVIGNFLTPFSFSLQLALLLHHVAIFDYCTVEAILDKIKGASSSPKKYLNIRYSFRYLGIRGEVYFMFEEEKVLAALESVAIEVESTVEY